MRLGLDHVALAAAANHTTRLRSAVSSGQQLYLSGYGGAMWVSLWGASLSAH